MYYKILKTKKYSFKQKIKILLRYYSRRKGGRIGWMKRYKKVNTFNPQLLNSCNKEIEYSHIKFWKSFHKRINIDTFRVSSNISGIQNFKYIPEEVFFSDIEPSLNKMESVKFLEIKNYYNKWFGSEFGFPEIYINKIDGVFFDNDLNKLSEYEVYEKIQKLNESVVLKSSKDSSGGRDVYFMDDCNEMLEKMKIFNNCVIQERLKLNKVFSKITNGNPISVRIYLYKSVTSNEWNPINMVLRMAKGDSLDNETDGGILTLINKDASLNGYAVDKYGKKYFNHPDSNLPFEGKIPNYDRLIEISIKVSQKIPSTRLVGLDLIYDINGVWRLIEINIFGTAIRLAQYHGKDFFDIYTDEVINYCKENHWTLSD